MATARMTRHARERCAEMGISTKVAKRIVAHPSVTYRGTPSEGRDTKVVLSSTEPDYAVVVFDDGREPPVVVTVLFNTPEFYERAGATYIPKGACA